MNESSPAFTVQSEEKCVYESIPFTDSMFPIRINRNSEMTATSGYTPITWHEQMELLIFLDGEGVCVCDGQRLPCTAGDIILVNPCEPHMVEYVGGHLRYHCLMIDPNLYTNRDEICTIRYIRAVTERRIRFQNRISDNTTVRALLDDILNESLAQETGYEMAVKGDILKLFAELFRHACVQDSPQRPKPYDTEQLSPALCYMAEHYTADITLSDLAKCCCMNPSYFCRRFHALTGRTAVTYLNEYRLAKAQALLLTTSVSVAEVAQSVGFSDSSYFTRCYRALFGVSPSETRKQHKIVKG